MKRTLIVLVFGALTLVACGSSSAPQTKVVYRTPAACTQALDLGDQLIGEASTALGMIGDAMTSLGGGDQQPLLDLPSKLDSATARVRVLKPKYDTARTGCEAGA